MTRQVLAEPSADLAGHTWAALADGTPLVTQATRGAGRVVLFHVTANADWSNLPLSGLFVDMLRRLVALSAGVAPASDSTMLAPAETLDGFGLLSAPPQAATGLPANEIASTTASPRHPPGLYGPENGRRALNLGANLPLPEAAPPVPGARVENYGGDAAGACARARAAGRFASSLLALDLLIVAGAARLAAAQPGGGALALASARGAHARTRCDASTNPALATRLGYIVTGDGQVDGISRAGLDGLSDYVNRRTAATLVEPDAVQPGEDRSELLSAALLADHRRTPSRWRRRRPRR